MTNATEPDLPDLSPRISREVAERRHEAGMRQIDMWTALGMSKTSYRELEQNHRDWTLRALQGAAAVFGVRVSDIIRAAEDRQDSGDLDRVTGRVRHPRLSE